MNEYKRRWSRTKRKNIPLKLIEGFKSPEHYSLFNSACKNIERRRSKKFSVNEYIFLINLFKNEDRFNENCDLYLANKKIYTKPNFTKNKSYEKYSVDNIVVSDLKKLENYKNKDSYVNEMRSISNNMKNSVGYDYLKQFDDPEKIRYILREIKSISNNKNESLSSEQKRIFISTFYNDKEFNLFYKKWINTNEKLIRPCLDLKNDVLSLDTYDINHLHFISYLEKKAKGNIKWKDWCFIKERLNEFIQT